MRHLRGRGRLERVIGFLDDRLAARGGELAGSGQPHAAFCPIAQFDADLVSKRGVDVIAPSVQIDWLSFGIEIHGP